MYLFKVFVVLFCLSNTISHKLKLSTQSTELSALLNVNSLIG